MESQAIFVTVAAVIGFTSFSCTLLRFFRWIWVAFLRPPKNLKHYYGSWALITGSTDGIGKAMALELGSKGLNLVLVGRNTPKLDNTSNEIRQKYGTNVEVKCIVIDFSNHKSDEIVKKIEKGIDGLDVGVVICNAGLAFPYAKFFHEVELDLMDGVVRVNIEGATWVTRAVLPGMLKKNKGAIVIIGSGSASSSIVPSFPLYSVYAATKAYIGMFTRSISMEYKKQGIDVQCQIPLLVATKMTSIRRSSFFIPSPQIFSKASIRWIGYEHTCVPYWTHSIQCCIMRALPDALLDKAIFSYFLGIRNRGLVNDSLKKKNNT